MPTLRELLDEQASSLKLEFNDCTLHAGLTRTGSSQDAQTAPHGRFFADRVSDAMARRERADGSSVISLCFEQ